MKFVCTLAAFYMKRTTLGKHRYIHTFGTPGTEVSLQDCDWELVQGGQIQQYSEQFEFSPKAMGRY